jgi:ABC-2 type transport system permease protein
MNIVWVLLKKEFKSFFFSPLAFILTAVFTFITGLMFFNLLTQFISSLNSLPAHMTAQINIVDAVVLRLFGNMNLMLIFVAPLISMKLISEEKKQGSIDLLLKAPIVEWQIVLSKFLAACLVVLFMLLATSIIPFILSRSGMYETPVLLTGYLSLFLNAALYISLGLIASALTNNQIVAAILGLSFCLFLWLLSFSSGVNDSTIVSDIFRFLGPIDHFQNIARGLVSSVDIFYYVGMIFIILNKTNVILESRRW